MYGSNIECFLSVTDTKETGTLFKCLRAKLRYLQKFLSALESAVFFSIGNYIFSNRFVDTGDITE